MKLTPLYLGIILFVTDMVTKFLTTVYLSNMLVHNLWYPYGGVGVFKDFFGIDFSIIHATNRGAAWGILADWQEPLLYLRIALVIGLCLYAAFGSDSRKRWPLACIIAGAAGNVVDYFFYGHVIDMLHFTLWGYEFPTFNVADSVIFIGIVALMLLPSSQKIKSRKQNA